MNNHPKKTEQGQAIVYLVLGIIVFFGFVALAIDGGMVLADRRHEQNAADAASLAGGSKAAEILTNSVCPNFFSCDVKSAAEEAARRRADDNGFTIVKNLNGPNGVYASCTNTSDDKYIDVRVEITATTQSNFLQLVYPSALHNDVAATTRVYPMLPIGTDAAVIALNPNTCTTDNGIAVTGNGTVTVNGGGMFSNGCIQGGGTPASALVINGTIESHYNDPQNTTFTPTIGTTGDTLNFREYYIPPPAMDAAGDCIGGNNVNSLPKVMTPGLYCLKASDNVTKDITGDNVTIYLSGNVHLSIASGANVHLTAPSNDSYSPAIPHVLIYAANGANITINGDSNDFFGGLIYAPDEPSQILMNGSAENVFVGQIVGWNVKINGTNDMNITYDACNGYISPTTLQLNK
jgi:hypothetical protein